MRRANRAAARLDGVVEARRMAATLGSTVRAGRRRRRISQSELGRRVGLTQSRISDVERGLGIGLPLETWVALGIALGQPLAISFSRPIRAEDGLADAGHLEVQEYLLEIGRRNGRGGSFELPTQPSDPARSIDVCHVDEHYDCFVIEEAWNRMGDLGAAARSSVRKVADMEHRGVAGRVALCWVIRDSAANHALVRRYPEVLAARFPGSSIEWVAALEDGTRPPDEPGLVWFEPSIRRCLRPMRLRRTTC